MKEDPTAYDFTCQCMRSVRIGDLFEPTEESHCSYEDWRSQYICHVTEEFAKLALMKMELNGLVLTEKEVLTAVYARLDQVPDECRTRLKMNEEANYAFKAADLSNISDKESVNAEWKNVSARYYQNLDLFINATARVKESFVFNYTAYFEKAGIQNCSWKERSLRIIVSLTLITSTLIVLVAGSVVMVIYTLFEAMQELYSYVSNLF